MVVRMSQSGSDGQRAWMDVSEAQNRAETERKPGWSSTVLFIIAGLLAIWLLSS